MTNSEKAAFDRCVDFLAQMIEKYGSIIDAEKQEIKKEK